MNNEKLYDQVTEKIISHLEKGVIPWRKPWKTLNTKPAMNYISKKFYTGVNFFVVNSMNFDSPYWMTFKQAQQKGGKVKKGEKGTVIVFWKTFDIKEENKKGEEVKKTIPFMKYSHIFNLEQIEGIEKEENENISLIDHNPIEECEKLISKFPLGIPEVKHVQSRAFYSPSLDFINLPKIGSFEKKEEYYQTYFHEVVHSTGHKNRLNRSTLTDIHYFGDENYSQEELIAEMGASYLSAFCGIDSITLENSAAYISNWLSALRKDNKLLLKSASYAQKAVNYLIGSNQTEE